MTKEEKRHSAPNASTRLLGKTYWYPDGLFSNNGNFSLISENNPSVMRYVWQACLLPTTVDEYARTLVIPTDNLPEEITTELQDIVNVFRTIIETSSVFRDETWPSLIDVVGTVYNYAIRAGGTHSGSYYYNMLDWNIDKVQTAAKDIQTKLSEFKTACAVHESKLEPIIGSVQNKLGSLDGEGGKIAETLWDNDAKKVLLEQEMRQYDKDDFLISYSGIFGAVAAVSVAAIYGNKATRLKKAAMVTLQTHFTSVKVKSIIPFARPNLTSLKDDLEGSITDLGYHIGVWQTIKTKLMRLKGLVDDLEDIIQPVLLEKVDLDNIVAAWNELAVSANDYQLKALQNDTPQSMSVETYLDELSRKE
ncbi:hypothetical protein BJX70DRAFT_388493 [Aspergillus crustosus]